MVFFPEFFYIEIEWRTTPLPAIIAASVAVSPHFVGIMIMRNIRLYGYLARNLLCCVSLVYNRLLFLAPLWRDADKNLEVDARHWSREYREILLVEEVVDCTLQGEVCPAEREEFFERDIAHKVLRQSSCK